MWPRSIKRTSLQSAAMAESGAADSGRPRNEFRNRIRIFQRFSKPDQHTDQADHPAGWRKRFWEILVAGGGQVRARRNRRQIPRLARRWRVPIGNLWRNRAQFRRKKRRANKIRLKVGTNVSVRDSSKLLGMPPESEVELILALSGHASKTVLSAFEFRVHGTSLQGEFGPDAAELIFS